MSNVRAVALCASHIPDAQRARVAIFFPQTTYVTILVLRDSINKLALLSANSVHMIAILATTKENA